MVSDFGMTRYCDVCKKEIVRKGDVITRYEGQEFCECDKEQKKKMKYEKLYDYLRKKCNFRKEKGKDTWTCFGDLRFVKEFCKKHNLNFKKIKERVEGTGGYCDCEVLFNSTEKINDNEVLD